MFSVEACHPPATANIRDHLDLLYWTICVWSRAGFTYDINLSLECASGGAGTSDLHGGQLSPRAAFRVVYLREVGAVTILQNCAAFQEIKNKIKKGNMSTRAVRKRQQHFLPVT